MKVLVLLAGVLDPKWPVAASGAALPDRPADRLVLSPFDEAALEIALKLRDMQPGIAINAVVAGGHDATKLARAARALGIADVSTIALTAAWDQATTATELAKTCEGYDLILLGREFGDCDDGLIPPMLAGLLGYAYFGKAQAVEAADEVRLLRENGAFEERCHIVGNLVVSVTNDRRVRLRKPLMKNVMMARQAPVGTIEPASAPGHGVELLATHELAGTRAPVHCALIEGSLRHQAEQLAAMLIEARP